MGTLFCIITFAFVKFQVIRLIKVTRIISLVVGIVILALIGNPINADTLY